MSPVADGPPLPPPQLPSASRSCSRRRNDSSGSVAPSTAHQVTLDLSDGAPSSFHLEPPAFHLHCWIAGAGIVTHQAYIGEFPGPYPFSGDS